MSEWEDLCDDYGISLDDENATDKIIRAIQGPEKLEGETDDEYYDRMEDDYYDSLHDDGEDDDEDSY